MAKEKHNTIVRMGTIPTPNVLIKWRDYAFADSLSRSTRHKIEGHVRAYWINLGVAKRESTEYRIRMTPPEFNKLLKSFCNHDVPRLHPLFEIIRHLTPEYGTGPVDDGRIKLAQKRFLKSWRDMQSGRQSIDLLNNPSEADVFMGAVGVIYVELGSVNVDIGLTVNLSGRYVSRKEAKSEISERGKVSDATEFEEFICDQLIGADSALDFANRDRVARALKAWMSITH